MDELVADLEATLLELDGYGSDSERTLVVPARARGVRRRRRRPPVFLVLLALGVLLGAAAVFLFVDGTYTDDGGGNAAAPTNVRLTAATAYDPEGTGGEHDDEAPLAIDGNPATFWRTEDYQDFTKSGVGIVVTADTPAALDELTVSTDTPGFPARIRASNSAASGFVDVSDEQTTSSTTTFELDTKDSSTATTSSGCSCPRAGSPTSTR
jgi:serine/threonine-protein kinase